MKFRLYLFVALFATLFAASLQAAPLTIGLVLSSGGLHDESFNDAAYEGVQNLRKDGALVEVVDPGSVSGIEPALRYFCRRKLDLVCAVGVFANDAVRHVAAEFPDTKIILIDSVVSAPNVLSILFDEEQGSFFAGAFAALISKKGCVGFMGGMNSPVIGGFEKGFKNGATFVNDKIKFVSKYLGNTPEAFDMVNEAEKVGNELSKSGADVIYHAAGKSGLGLIAAARRGDFYVIGVDSDQSKIAPGKVAASVVKRIDIALVKAVEIVKKGSFNGGVWTLGLQDHGIELVYSRFNRNLITHEVSIKLDEIEDFLINK
jgi:basic membrane protein A